MKFDYAQGKWFIGHRLLLAWAMRGHFPAVNPLLINEQELIDEIGRRQLPSREKRWMRGDLAGVVQGVIAWGCDRRQAPCLEVLVARSCVYAVVDIKVNEGGLLDAVRLLTARRARRTLGWPKAERVFTKRHHAWPLVVEEPYVELRTRFPRLAEL